MSPILAVDLFPRTRQKSDINLGLSNHVETVVLLSQREKRSDISLSLNINPKASKAETKATYREIAEYVKKYFDLDVPSLYIAQVKAEYGIIERENYNLGKEGHKVPICPEEKFKAIEEALRHFQMI